MTQPEEQAPQAGVEAVVPAAVAASASKMPFVVGALVLAGLWGGGAVVTPVLDPTCSVVQREAWVVRSPCGHQWVKGRSGLLRNPDAQYVGLSSGMYFQTAYVSAPDSFFQIGTVYKCSTGYRVSPDFRSEAIKVNSSDYQAVLNNCVGTRRRY